MATLSRGEDAKYRWEISDRELTLVISSLIDSLTRNSPEEINYFFGWNAPEITRFVEDTNRQVAELERTGD
ncbi:hypothetical protein [Sphaerisporangium album]|nr:hypothetical protein [Sphaerisporangium album]